MKIKNTMKSLVWMFAAILAMSACSSKDDIPNNRTDEDAPLSVVFSVENETTKAVGDEISPSEKEVNVKRYHVALFKNGTRVDHKEYGDGTGSSLLPAGANTYKASFSDVVEGNVAVYVIANYPSGQTFPDTDWGTYEQYKAQSVTSDLNETDGLVKVGYKEFTVNSIETGKTVLNLSLIQLTAGIDVEVAYDDLNLVERDVPARYDFLDNTASNEYPIDSESDIEKYIKKNYLVETIKNYLDFKPGSAESKWASELSTNNYTGWNSAGKTWFNRNKDKVYEKLAPTEGALYFRAQLKLEEGSGDNDKDGYNDYLTDIRITAKGRDVMCDVYVPVDGFVTGDVSIVNRNKESNILIIKNDEVENSAYTPDALTTFSTRFYTYELNKEHAMELQVKIGRGLCLYNVYQKKYRQYGYIIQRGQWIKVGNDNHGAYDWEAETLQKEAWLPVTKDSKLLDDSKVVARTASVTDPGELTDVHTYALTIPGEKIIKGHLYKVKGTHTTIVKPVISWEVVGMDKVEVDPEPFE